MVFEKCSHCQIAWLNGTLVHDFKKAHRSKVSHIRYALCDPRKSLKNNSSHQTLSLQSPKTPRNFDSHIRRPTKFISHSQKESPNLSTRSQQTRISSQTSHKETSLSYSPRSFSKILELPPDRVQTCYSPEKPVFGRRNRLRVFTPLGAPQTPDLCVTAVMRSDVPDRHLRTTIPPRIAARGVRARMEPRGGSKKRSVTHARIRARALAPGEKSVLNHENGSGTQRVLLQECSDRSKLYKN